jgi:DNA-binding transcriptional MocR family regulator
LWGAVPAEVDLNLLVQDAYRHKILLVRGATFSAGHGFDSHLRFNVAYSQQPRLAEFLRERLQALAGARGLLEGLGGPQHALSQPSGNSSGDSG